jgi:hypothetical protein
MRRLASLLTLLVCACAREPSADPTSDAGPVMPDGARVSPDAPQVDDVAQDRTGPDDSAPPPPDVTSPADGADSSAPNADVGGPDLGSLDVFDVGRASDGRVSDRCGSLYRAAIPIAIETIAADDAGGVDATDARAMDVADVRDQDRRVDADAPDATLDQVCFALHAEFRAFVQQNNACDSASDCVFVVGVRDCSCYRRGIGEGSGSGVSASVSAEAQSYVARWSAAGCESWQSMCLQDQRPSDSVECLQGKCWANSPPGCLPPLPEPRSEPCQ